MYPNFGYGTFNHVIQQKRVFILLCIVPVALSSQTHTTQRTAYMLTVQIR